jgi:CRP-like cAMP-binding protein
LAPSLKRVRLEAGSILYDVGASVDRAWFPTGGIVSLLSVTENGDTVEAAMIGHDGLIGFPGIVRRNGAAFRACVQVAGEALLCDAKALRAAIKQGNGLYDLLLDYAYCMSEQIAQCVVCTRFHPREQRLARWLLLAHDRTRSDAFTLTHDAFSQIFGLSRSGVSLAARALQKKGLIDYSRGHIAILNSEGLEDVCCECYRILSRAMNFSAFHTHRSKNDRVKL